MTLKADKIGKHSASSQASKPSDDSSILGMYAKYAVSNPFLRRPLIKVVRSKLKKLGFASDLQFEVSNDAEVLLRGIKEDDLKKIA